MMRVSGARACLGVRGAMCVWWWWVPRDARLLRKGVAAEAGANHRVKRYGPGSRSRWGANKRDDVVMREASLDAFCGAAAACSFASVRHKWGSKQAQETDGHWDKPDSSAAPQPPRTVRHLLSTAYLVRLARHHRQRQPQTPPICPTIRISQRSENISL